MRWPGAAPDLDDGRLHAPAWAPYAERADPVPGPIDRSLAAAWSRIEGGPLRQVRRRAAGRLADAAMAMAPQVGALNDAAFRLAVTSLRERLTAGPMVPALIAECFAMVREATKRQTGLQHHRVQLMGGAAMLGRTLAEMETGEGKTITAALPAALFALAGRPVHVVTVNDYLAQRDAEQLRGLYGALGLSVGVVVGEQSTADRLKAYAADVTYCTNKDLVFDYLRDRLALGRRRSHTRRMVDALVGLGPDPRGGRATGSEPLLLRGLHVAIVDEADSVLIDEARTPLILSGPDGSGGSDGVYEEALALARCLEKGSDYTIDRESQALRLAAPGQARLDEMASGLGGIWAARRAREELVEQALKAAHLFQRGVQYLVVDGKVQIIDEYTGRTMPDRTWEHGLHQMVEAKEGCGISGGRKTIAKITYQRFFARYGHLCGMTGTATEARSELSSVYNLGVLRIPTHHRLQRRHDGTRLLPDAGAKWAAVAARAAELSGKGRPVLIGTRSVDASETVAALLRERGLSPLVLNALQSREEAAIVARAGQPTCITVATNMAGRGTDIRLSNPARKAGGLHVILTEYHESARIDRQLFGRCARQGNPGSVEAIVAADDEVFARYAGPRRMRSAGTLAAVLGRFGRKRLARWPLERLVRAAQGRAERQNARIRRDTLKSDLRLETSLAFAGRQE